MFDFAHVNASVPPTLSVRSARGVLADKMDRKNLICFINVGLTATTACLKTLSLLLNSCYSEQLWQR